MRINLYEWFEDTVGNNPHKIAVKEGNDSIYFADLKQKAETFAAYLLSKSDVRNKPIAVFLPKCIEAVIADLGAVASANPFMNLDVKTPANRISNIIDLIEPAFIVTDAKNAKLLPANLKVEVILIEDALEYDNLDSFDLKQRRASVIDTDPFCIINTSGSTGTPKGVALNHLSFFDFMYRSVEAFNLTDTEIMGSLSPIVFDIFVYELTMLMCKSTTIVLLPAQYSAFPAKLLDILRKERVTFIFWVPTIMVNIANMGLMDNPELSELKLVWFAGEVFPTKQFNVWRRGLPHTKFANLYGPIETTLDSIYYVIEREIPDNEPIPIGYAYRNTDILLLDEKDSQVTEPGYEGEICVRGSSLALGYYNNPEKTGAAFVQNPLNKHYPERIYRTGDVATINELGEIVFKGRKDSLVKHLGYRIELGEIEHVLVNTKRLVKNGCIVYNVNEKQIALYYEHEEELSAAYFRKELAGDLPKYMIPTKYVRLDELQRNTNGKIDRLYYKNLENGI